TDTGVPLGSFRLYPTLDLASYYDTNVYRTSIAKNSDFYFTERPAFTLKSGWSRDELVLFGWVNSTQYVALAAEDNTNWEMGGNGRYDFSKGLDVTLNGFYSTNHEQRGSPDLSQLAKSPTQFTNEHGDGVLSYHPYQFSISVSGSYDRYVFDPTQLVD